MKNLLLSAICMLFVSCLHAQAWAPLGNPCFSISTAVTVAMAIDPAGTPYVVYGGNAGATVMKYNGTHWVTVGSPDISGDTTAYTAIAIDRYGTPYVAYSTPAPGGWYCNPVMVKKFDGTSWVNVGSGQASAGLTTYLAMAIDSSGMPYVAFKDYATASNGATVVKYNGSSWVTVGIPGFTPAISMDLSLAISPSGTPYIVYDIWGGGPGGATQFVMDYDGTGWEFTGSNYGPGAFGGEMPSIAVDRNGIVYVAFINGYLGVSVMEYTGGHTWSNVGTSGFPPAPDETETPAIALDSSGTPYVAFLNYPSSHGGICTVMRYNGSSWVALCSQYCSVGVASSPSIAIASGGTPYVAFADWSDSGYVTVMKPDTALAPIAAPDTLCIHTTGLLTDAKPGGTWSTNNTTLATVDSAGIITGVGEGTVIITYTRAGNYTLQSVYIDSILRAFVLMPQDSICQGTNLPIVFVGMDGGYEDLTGAWYSSDTSIATIDSTGTLWGRSPGTISIIYIVSNYCGSDTGYFPFTISNCPNLVKNTIVTTAPLSVFPNPNHGICTMHISLSMNENATIIIANMLGEKVKEFTAYDGDTGISLNEAPGVYFIKVITSVGEQSAKIVVW